MTVDSLDDQLQPLLPLIAEEAAEAERLRRPSPAVMEALGAAGLLRLLVPEHFGGHEIHPRRFMEFTEQVSRVHGSTGWTAMTCNEEAGIASAYLEPEAMISFYAEHPEAVVAGSGVPKGRARPTEGGWEISGRWPFVSGCTAAHWIVLAALIEGTRPAELCFALVPRGEVTIDDTWHTAGLRGTGSNDVVLEHHFVPHRMAGVIDAFALPKPDTAFYRLPSGLRFPFPKVGVAAGLAHAALDEFRHLASAKKPLNHHNALRERPTAQAAVARAEALVGSGWAWARRMADELWDAASADHPISDELHARCRLACSHAVASCIEAVELLAGEAGSTANFTSSPLPRHVADVRAVAAHFMVAPYQKQTAGRLLLGLDADDPNF